jgi:alpha-glucosidase
MAMRTLRQLSATTLLALATVTWANASVAAELAADETGTDGTAASQDARRGTWTVSHDDVTATVDLDDGGRLRLAIGRDGEEVTAGNLGLRSEDGTLSADLRFVERVDREIHETYSMVTGKASTIANDAHEADLRFVADGGRTLTVTVRAADDGVAYRYAVGQDTVVLGELSSFEFDTTASVWMQPFKSWHENYFSETTVGEAGIAPVKPADWAVPDAFSYQALLREGDTYAFLAESGMSSSYPGARLHHSAQTEAFSVQLSEARVDLSAGGTTPWRAVITGDLETVTESTMITDLAPPSRIADTSWVRPGRAAWSWLTDWGSPRNFERQKEFVDFAAEHGWEYVLVDEGWSPTWIPELTRYANARGVDIIVWYRWWDLDTSAEREREFGRLNDWGVKGVKIDFMNLGGGEPEGVGRHRWYEETLQATAEHHLLVNFHGSTIPKGLQRTWPHLMTYEGVKGAEAYTFSENLPPSYNATLPFTRNLVGSMDYTPVTPSRTAFRTTSLAHEYALSVVYESGLQHLADLPETYASSPEGMRFLDQLPSTWDTTELVSGAPGESAVLARRSGERWFVGGIFAGPAREHELSTAYLGEGDWIVEVLDDATVPGTLQRTTSTVTAGDTVKVPVSQHGGFLALACPALPGRESCDETIERLPATQITADPAEVTLAGSGSITVNGVFSVVDDVRLSDVSIALEPPAGWTAVGDAVAVESQTRDDPLTASWEVRPPTGLPSGTYEIRVGARYDDPRTAAPASEDARYVDVATAVTVRVPTQAPAGDVRVSGMPFMSESNGWGPVERDRSNGERPAGDGTPITLGGATFEHGIGVHAPSTVVVYLGGRCTEFDAVVGVDDAQPTRGSVEFQAVGDGRTLARSGVLRASDPGRAFHADVTGVDFLELQVADGGDGNNNDHADWAAATLRCADAKPLEGVHPVSNLLFVGESNGWGPVERGASNGEQARGDGAPLTIDGTTYAHGLGTHARSEVTVYLGGTCSAFTAAVGVDDSRGTLGSVVFSVLGDGSELATTQVVTGGDPAVPLKVDLEGVDMLTLRVTDAGDGNTNDHADWGDALVTCAESATPGSELPVDVTVEPRCLAGKAYVAVRVENASDVTVSARLVTGFGERELPGILPGRSAYRSFPTRATAVQGGTVTTEVTGAVGGALVTRSVESPYDAMSCG